MSLISVYAMFKKNFVLHDDHRASLCSIM